MEKRTILAFVLSFIILVAWAYFFGSQKDQAPRQDQEPVQEQVADKGAAPRVSDVPKAQDVAPPAFQQPVEKTQEVEIPKKVDEKEIEINTPLYRAVFTNAGPTLKSFKLKKYRETTQPGSPLIELAGLGQEMAQVFLIKFDALSGGKDEKIAYNVDQETIRLGPESSPRNLVFRAMTPTGLSINQTFRFYPDQYKIDLEMRVTNSSGSMVKGVYRADIHALPPKKKKGYYSFVGLAILVNDELEELDIEEPSES
ncbi:MAG: membrane protein insertase YidC, partial [Deltaproteobacteria bacterium]|nr:membrane protein insertase YidC [Deltaproteobacteria bacterium]